MADPDPNHPVVGFGAEHSLADLNQFIVQKEDVLGPLEKIGNNGVETALQFDMTTDPPKKQTPPLPNAVIALTVGGQAVIPKGATKISQGKVFITGQRIDAVAYRPK